METRRTGKFGARAKIPHEQRAQIPLLLERLGNAAANRIFEATNDGRRYNVTVTIRTLITVDDRQAEVGEIVHMPFPPPTPADEHPVTTDSKTFVYIYAADYWQRIT